MPKRRRKTSSTAEAHSIAQPPSAKTSSMARLAKKAVVHVVVVAVLVGGYFVMVKDEVKPIKRFKLDEYGWVVASHSTFKLIFLDEQSGPESWHQGVQTTVYGAMNPNFAKLIMGFALYCWGYDLPTPDFLKTGHTTWWEMNDARRNQLGKAHRPYLIKMRWLVLWMGAACAVALYYSGRVISGPVLGIGAYVAYVFTPLVKVMSFTVFTDNVLMLMVLLSLMATIMFARWWAKPESADSRWRTVGSLLLIAILYGATVATKFNGAVVCIACALSVALLWAAGRFKHHRFWITPVGLLGVGIVAFAAFVLVNPQLYEDVPGRITWSLNVWSELLSRLQAGGSFRSITTFEEQVAAVYRRALLESGPCARFLPVGAILLIGAGLIITCRRVISGFRNRGDVVGPTLLLIWSTTVIVMTTLWLPFDWPRYYLPFVPAFCLLQAIPIESAIRLLTARRRAGNTKS